MMGSITHPLSLPLSFSNFTLLLKMNAQKDVAKIRIPHTRRAAQKTAAIATTVITVITTVREAGP